MEANNWLGSQVNVHVAKILLEKMGYPVDISYSDSNVNWEKVASGQVHANLEVFSTSFGLIEQVWGASGQTQERKTFVEGLVCSDICSTHFFRKLSRIFHW